MNLPVQFNDLRRRSLAVLQGVPAVAFGIARPAGGVERPDSTCSLMPQGASDDRRNVSASVNPNRIPSL